MTSLALQLQKLSVPHTQAILGEDKKRPSLLFDPKEAANLDKETVYGIGLNGLEELENLDETFQEFEETLFSETAQDFERSTQTKEVNQKLNKTISQFLIKLSPYFLLKPAHKVIEWLVYRYHIHFYNIDDLLMCILPYHETKIFVRAVQLLKLDDSTNRWHWLQPIQKPGVPLPRTTVMTHCNKDPSFLNFVCDMVHKFLKVHGTKQSVNSPLRVLFSFFTTTLIGALNQGIIKDAMIAQLLPVIVNGLKSKSVEYKVAVYMILSLLASKARIKSSFFDSLLPIMSKHIPVTLVQEALTCLLVIYQYQNLSRIPKRMFKYLCKLPGVIDVIARLSQSFLVTPFLQPFLKLLISEALNDSTDEEDPSPDEVPYAALLERLLMECDLDEKLKGLIAKSLLENFMSLKTGETTSEDVDLGVYTRRLKHFIGVVEKRHPVAMDVTIEEQMKQKPSKVEQGYLQEFVALSVSTAKHSIMPKSQTSLMLGLNHPKWNIRLLAVQQLMQLANESEEEADEFLKDSLMTRLQDDDPRVVKSLLEAGEDLQRVLGADSMYESTVKIMRNHFGKPTWTTVIKLCVGHLTGLNSSDLEPQITTLLLPYIMVTSCKVEHIDLVRGIFKSNHAKKSKILSAAAAQWIKLAGKEVEDGNKREFWIGFQNLSVVLKMAGALAEQTEQREHLMPLLLSECLTPGPLQLVYTFITLNLMAEMMEKLESNHARIQCGIKCLEIIEGNNKLFKPQKGANLRDPVSPASFRKCLSAITSSSCIPLNAVICVLEKVISAIQLPSKLVQQNWWKITSEDDEENLFLKFTLKCFDLLTSFMDNQDVKYTELYKIAFEHLFKTYFKSKPLLFKLLSIPLTSSAMIREETAMPISVILQARALHVAIPCLAAATKKELVELLAADSVVIPSLLVALTSPHHPIRLAATHCLKDCMNIHDIDPALDTSLAHLVHQLTNRKEELEADGSYLPQALYVILSKAFKTIKAEKLTPKKLKRKEKAQEIAQNCLESLIGAVVKLDCPCYIQDSLLASLSQISSPRLLETLLPLLKHLLDRCTDPGGLNQSETKCVHYLMQRFTETTTELFQSNLGVKEAFYRALHTSVGHHVEYMSVQGVMLQQISKDFFTSLPTTDLQQQLISELIDLWVDTKDAKTASNISKVLKALPLTADQIVTELNKVKNTTKAATVREVKRIRRTSKPDIEPVISAVDTRPWQRVTLTLEMLQAKRKVQDMIKLVPIIFDITRRCLDLDDHNASEYLKQLLLSCILNICAKVEGDQEQLQDLKSSNHFKVDLIVQCIRTSENPQTHHHALMLLTMAAKLFPDLVLHNIMSVFTFMGANIMRQDDSYSFQVISKTVETVIPALIAAHTASKDKGKLDTVVASVIQVFVDAYPHIPEHRRLPILSKLVSTLGGATFLWTTLLLLLDGYVMTEATKPQDEQDTKASNYVHPMVTFCLDLSNQFEPDVQMITAKMFMQFLVKLPEKEKDAPVKMREVSRRVKKQSGESASLISVDQHTAKQLRYFRYTVTAFIVQILSDKRFISKVVSLDDRASSAMVPHYQLLLEENLRYINHIAKLTGQNSDQPSGKFWRIVLTKAYEILDKVNSLLPSNVFVSVVSGLMKNEMPIVRRKAMELLNNKLQHSKDKIEDEEVPLFLGLVGQLLSVVKASGPGSDTEDEVAINKQTALFSLKVLCRIFGTAHPQTFKPILPVLTELFAQPAANPQVMASGLLCLAELCQNLRAHAIPSLPLFMPRLIHVLKNEKKLASNDLLLVSSVTVVHKVVESLSHFLSPYVLDIMTKVVQLSSDLPDDEATQKTQLYIRLKAVRVNLATKLPSRVLLPTVAKCYDVISAENKLCLGPLMGILTDHISDISRDNLASHHNQILTFFLQALDYRTKHSQQSLSDIEAMEGHVISAVVSMVMRLSEATFRPMFFKLFDWAIRDDSHKERLLVFYRLANGIADKLKTLFTLFAGHIVKNAANLMDENKPSKSKVGTFGASEDGVTKSCQLLKFIFGVLHKCFLYDNEGFLNKERFDTLLQPLVDQVENQLGSESEYELRINDHLVPCIGQFALASGDDSAWKPLNYQICLKTRHSSPKVRFAALKLVEELSKKLGDDYMVLLPETIQFLAELLEDDSYEVEQQCQEVISHLEKVIGEPLQKYF
ncbi:HEAT repeat-containing protein 1-like [Lineus longissimus]|uniref:HEAT repeat-containing protein 1-like n=1 Tax=Lineus longissimus TaxID=88925 RepID=UPI002B4C4E85